MNTYKLQVEYIKGETVNTKYGEKTKYSIKTPDGKWYGSFSNLAGIKQGDYIEGEVSSREYNGKAYYDFKLPKKEDLLEQRIEKLEEAMKIVKQLLKQKETDERPDFLKDPEEEVIIPFD